MSKELSSAVVKELVDRWREAAARRDAAAKLLHDVGMQRSNRCEAAVFRHCAYELEARWNSIAGVADGGD